MRPAQGMMKRCKEKNNNEHTEGRGGEGKEGRETWAEYETYLDNSYAGL